MERLYFEETQWMRQHRWLWPVVVACMLIAFIPMLQGAREQLVEGHPWGKRPMSDGGLIAFLITMVIGYAAVIWLLLSMNLEIKIDERGIHYRFFPKKRRWRLILKEEIVSCEIKKTYKFFESLRIGYHRNWLRNTISMNINGQGRLSVHVKSGRRFLIGVNNPESVAWAMKKLLEKNETI